MMKKSIIILVKTPEQSIFDTIDSWINKEYSVLVVSCIDYYLDAYRYKGYNAINSQQFFALKNMYKNKMFTLGIGNPPYGVGGNLAIKFLNKTAELTDDIRFVLPTSVRKPSSLNKISPYIDVVEDLDLDPKTFPNGISAVYQRWVKTDTPRKKIQLLNKHSDFEFLSYERRFEADVFVGEYGCGPSGRVKTENFTHYAKGHHFLKVSSPEVINNLVEFSSRFREVANQCNGRYHFGKNDLITTYMECLSGKKQA
jgi:hypothetical protein